MILYVEIQSVPPSGQLLATWDYGGTVSFWDAQNGTIRHSLHATERKGTNRFDISPDNLYMATGNSDHNTLLWDLSNIDSSSAFSLGNHEGQVKVVSFSEDGEYLFTGSADKTINIWKRKEVIVVDETSNFQDRELSVQKVVEVSSNRMELSVFDDEEIDGDIISVFLNDRLLLEEYTLKAEKKILDFALDPQVNLLVIYAHNEGSLSPNTIAVELNSGTFSENFKLRSDMNISAAIQIYSIPN